MNKESKIPSPCISVCTVEEDTGFCRGCLRTLKEIAEWPRYDDTERRALCDTLDKRRALVNNAGPLY